MNIELVVSLGEAAAADAAQVGRKAATLSELLQAGFPVPGGAVLTASALARAGHRGLGCDRLT